MVGPRLARSSGMGTAATIQSHCVHCGERSFGERFCCTGCRAAHALLTEAGLGRYYELGADDMPRPDAAGTAPHLSADVEKALQASPSDAVDAQLHIEGIRCAACVYAIEGLFDRVQGAQDIALNPATGNVRLRAGPGTDLAPFVQDLSTLGYRVRGQRGGDDGSGTDPMLLRAGILIAIALNVMTFSLSAYFGLDGSTHPSIYATFGHASLVLATIATAVGTKTFFAPAWLALRRGVASLDVPIVFGIVAAYGGSVASYFENGLSAAYFDTLCVFIALMVLGRALSGRMIEKNRRTLSEDAPLGALDVRRVNDDGLRFVRADDLRPGDTMLWVPGEMLPVDAVLLDAPVVASLAWLTGESEAVNLAVDETVQAGTQHEGDRAVRVRVVQGPGQSRLAQLLEPTPRDREGRGARWALLYVALVVAFAAGGFAWWAATADAARGLEVAVAVLVVTCPCAFGIAGPLADQLGLVALRRQGVLVRNMSLFERCRDITTVVLDKTGTVTLTTPRVSNAAVLRELTEDDRAALFNLVARSNHPKSRAVLDVLGPERPLWPDAEVIEEPGRGLALRRGTERAALRRDGDELWLFRDGVRRCRITFAESLAAGAAHQVRALQASVDVHLVSGDAPARTRDVAASLGLDAAHAHGGVSPEQKAAFVRQHDAARTMMIGDGLNDIAALSAAACAGVPHTQRTQLPARADFVALRSGMIPVSSVMDVARRVRLSRRGVFTLAGLYNVGVLALSLAGLITPLWCAVLMPASSVLFVMLTAALFRASAKPAPSLAPILKTSGSVPRTQRSPR